MMDDTSNTERMRRLILLLENTTSDDDDEEDLEDMDRKKRRADLLRNSVVARGDGFSWRGFAHDISDEDIERVVPAKLIPSAQTARARCRPGEKWYLMTGANHSSTKSVVAYMHIDPESKLKFLSVIAYPWDADPGKELDALLDHLPGDIMVLDQMKNGMLNQRRRVEHFDQCLENENTEFTLTGAVANLMAWKVSPEWLKRATYCLRMRGINKHFSSKKPDTTLLVRIPNDGWMLMAFARGNLAGVSSILPEATKIRISIAISKQLGTTAGVKIKPNSNMHKMLKYVEQHPGTNRSDWFVWHISNDPQGMQGYDGSLDGVAEQLGLLVLVGGKPFMYSLTITDRGRQVVSDLDAGKQVIV